MHRVWRRRGVAFGGLLLLALNAIAPLVATWLAVGTADTNGDGRADIWRYYDSHGRLTHVAVDVNYDDHPDVRYEFDPVAGSRLRADYDVDFDGRVDEVELFRQGRPVARFDRRSHGGPAVAGIHRFLHEVFARTIPAAPHVAAPSSFGAVAARASIARRTPPIDAPVRCCDSRGPPLSSFS